MKVVVYQSDLHSEFITREELIQPWIDYFQKNHFDYEIYGGFDAKTADETIGDADAAIGVWITEGLLTKEFFQRHPNLKYVATFAHGFEKFDLDYAKAHNITFTNTIYGDHTIAEFTMALLMEVLHHVYVESLNYKECLQENRKSTYACTKQMELHEKTVGIIGLGSIGYCFAKMVAGFGCKVLAYSRHKKEGEQYSFIEQVSLNDLLKQSDIISIHCPLTEETYHLIDEEKIHEMKDGVILLNTARGDIVDEDALVSALQSGKVYGAGLDVVHGEPLQTKSPIFDCKNVVITSHIAWLTVEARKRAPRIALENFDNWIHGMPTSVIK